MSTRSSNDNSSQSGLLAPIVPIGEVSVIPQAWQTRTPIRMIRSIIARGAAEPPIVTTRRCRGSSPVASMCWNIASHTVGTPAE